MNEKDLQLKILKYINSINGCWGFKHYSGMGMGKAGIPDIICSINRYFLAIEVKTEKGNLTKLQEETCLDIQNRGKGMVMIVYGWEHFKERFDFWFDLVLNNK